LRHAGVRVDFRTEISEYRRTHSACCIAVVPRIGVRTMRRINAPRSIAIARRTDDIQPTAVFGAIGMIATLMLMWIGLVL
jgi:hypothetical protein